MFQKQTPTQIAPKQSIHAIAATFPANGPSAPAPTQARSPMMTRKEAAVYLGLAYQTLSQWAVSHRYNLPVVKIGRTAKYLVADLDAFIARNVQGGASA
jgi:hypothetical protein